MRQRLAGLFFRGAILTAPTTNLCRCKKIALFDGRKLSPGVAAVAGHLGNRYLNLFKHHFFNFLTIQRLSSSGLFAE